MRTPEDTPRRANRNSDSAPEWQETYAEAEAKRREKNETERMTAEEQAREAERLISAIEKGG